MALIVNSLFFFQEREKRKQEAQSTAKSKITDISNYLTSEDVFGDKTIVNTEGEDTDFIDDIDNVNDKKS